MGLYTYSHRGMTFNVNIEPHAMPDGSNGFAVSIDNPDIMSDSERMAANGGSAKKAIIGNPRNYEEEDLAGLINRIILVQLKTRSEQQIKVDEINQAKIDAAAARGEVLQEGNLAITYVTEVGMKEHLMVSAISQTSNNEGFRTDENQAAVLLYQISEQIPFEEIQAYAAEIKEQKVAEAAENEPEKARDGSYEWIVKDGQLTGVITATAGDGSVIALTMQYDLKDSNITGMASLSDEQKACINSVMEASSQSINGRMDGLAVAKITHQSEHFGNMITESLESISSTNLPYLRNLFPGITKTDQTAPEHQPVSITLPKPEFYQIHTAPGVT